MANPRDTENGWSQLTRGAPLAVMVAVVLYILYQLLPVLELLVVAALIALILRTFQFLLGCDRRFQSPLW
ncbi:hypothetical protein A6769_34585 [Nostoc punctiforme NIES-2108]|uniref:Uncharacterized protein n=1 Tax=Nostoc punctiforme NIES-2108 TaxID=1356359 RepID=A0A367R0L0_NOSPU|nr:hypothetical protein A6769_34585 [Nostoc punctiforme NIES-2108]